ncbi:uncharacterized protein LOC113553179 [Rhopalosiphum maidis]|uniref:uncharacterized protein LOC113553179 n=1 Tax=Rhopalosiphum maidis TaxID=43146 RepID=UPI000EFED034|nr:uncharacterized protein LOC113553179 [Rhopalosiphum maidis]
MESRLQRSTSRCDRYYRCRRAAVDAFPMTSTLVAVFFSLVVLQIVSNTDQAALKMNVVRVVRVDVPPVVRSYDAKPDPATGGAPPPLLLGCVYALEGGENDDENGDVIAATSPPRPANGTATAANSARDRRSSSPAPDLAMDAAMEDLQRQRGLVVKWYFRRNPIPAAPNDAMAIINDNEQVYQWIAGGGPEAGGGLGPLSGRTVDVTAETPRTDRSFLHRVILVERPTAELTGEYRCQVEDWNSERRSAWHPMVVYTPERIFKISVDDNDDDDEDDIAEGSGGDVNFTTLAPPTSSSTAPTNPKKWPTEINITCYAAGMHPEPSMSIWVNGVSLDSVTSVVTEDDGDDDETNDGVASQTSNATMTPSTTTTTTTTTTTAKPKSVYRNNRYRGRADGEYKKYAVRATSVVSLKDAEEYRNGKPNQHHRRRNTVDVECRLRVPGDGAGDGHWKADRPADRYYAVRKSVTYKYRNDLPPPGDAFAAVSSASSVAEEGDDDADNYGGGVDRGAGGASNAQDAGEDAGSAGTRPTAAACFSIVVAAAAAVAAARR